MSVRMRRSGAGGTNPRFATSEEVLSRVSVASTAASAKARSALVAWSQKLTLHGPMKQTVSSCALRCWLRLPLSIHSEAAAVQLDEASRQGEAQPGALLQVRGARLLEGLEDARLVGGGDAGAVVAHAEHHLVAGGARADVDVPAALGELDRVGE